MHGKGLGRTKGPDLSRHPASRARLALAAWRPCGGLKLRRWARRPSHTQGHSSPSLCKCQQWHRADNTDLLVKHLHRCSIHTSPLAKISQAPPADPWEHMNQTAEALSRMKGERCVMSAQEGAGADKKTGLICNVAPTGSVNPKAPSFRGGGGGPLRSSHHAPPSRWGQPTLLASCPPGGDNRCSSRPPPPWGQPTFISSLGEHAR